MLVLRMAARWAQNWQHALESASERSDGLTLYLALLQMAVLQMHIQWLLQPL